MSMSDPIGDLLARIKNGQKAGHHTLYSPASKMRARILQVLKDEGFIRNFAEEQDDDGKKVLRIETKFENGEGAIRELHRVSKPGRRVYASAQSMPRFYNGLGVTIVSTPRGVMSDNEARKQNVGGEVIAQVF
ncbi:MAG: 30S ribosomal protein S8 [Alphaproteobacteria bacterium]|nr:30S ribosomal protein S8 [Alphaproteobacteria bacterium]